VLNDVFSAHTRFGFVNPILQFHVFLDDLHVLMLFLDEIETFRAVLNEPGDFLFLPNC
jgi:hypothetical protein